MAGGIGQIARALVNGAMARQKYRAMHRVGMTGWKGDLVRVLGNMASEAWRRRKAPAPGPGVPPGPRRGRF